MKYDIVQSRSGDYMGPLRNNLIFCWPSIEAAVSETAHDRYNVLIFVVADKYSPPIAPHPLMVYTNFFTGLFLDLSAGGTLTRADDLSLFFYSQRLAFSGFILLQDLLIIRYTTWPTIIILCKWELGSTWGNVSFLLGLHFAYLIISAHTRHSHTRAHHAVTTR